MIAAIPQPFIFEQSLIPGSSTKYRCSSTGYTAEWQRRVYFTIFASYLLFIPVLCMIIWYIKIIQVVGSSTKNWIQKVPGEITTIVAPLTTSTAKLKTVKLALTIITVFVVCWTPYIILTLIEIYSSSQKRIPSWLDGSLQTICLAQSSLNPFIYIAFNRKPKHSPIVIVTSARTASVKSRIFRQYYELSSCNGTVKNDASLNSYLLLPRPKMV